MEASPEFFQADGDYQNGDPFVIEEFLDIPNDESLVAADGGFEAAMTGSSTDSSTLTAVDNSCNSSAFSTAEPHFSHPASAPAAAAAAAAVGGHFSSELCVPYDGLDDLDWLSSSMVEESFSSEDLQKLQLLQGIKSTRPVETLSDSHHRQYQFQPETARPAPMLRPETSIPAKARSKRSRAAPGNWSSRLLVVNSPPPSSTAASSAVPTAMSSSSESDITVAVVKKPPAVKPAAAQRKKDHGHENASGEGRRCLHCATDKTPQWRTGPMGPKTLCNACGVRYKSGRLVPEYRPAASPTFVLTKHSNSHRKVLELRRQKEMMRAQQHQQHQQQQYLHHHHHQNMMFDLSNGDDYLIHQHIGPDFRQLI